MLSSWQEEKDNYVIVITHYARLTIRQSRLYSVEETNPRVMNSSRVTVSKGVRLCEVQVTLINHKIKI